jgi:hypothetical protein
MMAIRFWISAGAMLALAVLAGIGDWRRRRRRDLDRIGIVDWRTLQVIALMAAAILASVAFNV